MNAPRIHKPPTPSTPTGFHEQHLAHIANAIDMTLNACQPGDCKCGNRLPHHGARECGACWVAAVRRNLHKQREHRAMLLQQALSGDTDARAELDYLESDERDPAEIRAERDEDDKADQINAQDKEANL